MLPPDAIFFFKSHKVGVGRIITTDNVRREIDLEREPELSPAHGDRFPAPHVGETLKAYICRAVLAVYEMERAHLGSHSAAAHRLGMNRTTLYDWLEWGSAQCDKLK
ncbi:MAG TPA: hypothetical protein VJ810_27195 [Blastocatellia bacterium]|nr:hypothetical protein [Blastocatellia bacterium]